jgi:hypothetical protein
MNHYTAKAYVGAPNELGNVIAVIGLVLCAAIVLMDVSLLFFQLLGL